MDHRISKDMISSGMIPSGKKNQEDLSRTQYGTAPSPNALADVYKKMYEHHQKDKDGNTIPHEGEEINEAGPLALLAPLLGKGAAGAAAGKAAAAGATKMAATKAVGSTVAKGGIKQTMTRAGIKVGGKTGGQMVKTAIEKPLQTAANVSYASNMMPQTSSGKDGTKKTSSISASADLFDIVKGKLLDEGLSEDEALDIMLTLPVDEILNEMGDYPMGKGGNYRETPKPNKPEPKPGEPGSKLDAKGRQRFNPLNKDPYSGKTSKYDEEYKNFDPKKPDPKQVAAQAQQEKNKQKSSDPMGVKNTNIGGRGKDLG